LPRGGIDLLHKLISKVNTQHKQFTMTSSHTKSLGVGGGHSFYVYTYQQSGLMENEMS